jgi:hypothetical protein
MVKSGAPRADISDSEGESLRGRILEEALIDEFGRCRCLSEEGFLSSGGSEGQGGPCLV